MDAKFYVSCWIIVAGALRSATVYFKPRPRETGAVHKTLILMLMHGMIKIKYSYPSTDTVAGDLTM